MTQLALALQPCELEAEGARDRLAGLNGTRFFVRFIGREGVQTERRGSIVHDERSHSADIHGANHEHLATGCDSTRRIILRSTSRDPFTRAQTSPLFYRWCPSHLVSSP